jgi:rSAM/selenodomain-associated transferase 2
MRPSTTTVRLQGAPLRLSIVIPALDEEADLPGLLESLLPLREAGHQVIVADGQSADATFAIAQPAADVVFAVPRGRAAQMNAGAKHAQGDVLWFLHADSRLPPDAVQAIAQALAAGAQWGRFDVAITGRPRVLPLIAALMNLRSRWSGIATGDQGIFVTRELFLRVGGFAAIPLMEDIALSKTLKKHGGRPACLAPRITTSGRRWERQGPWRTIFTMWRLRLAFALGADPVALAREYR